MTEGHHHKLQPGERPFPLPPLVGAAILVIFSLISVAGYRIFFDTDTSPDANAQVLASRHLRFEDATDGQVIVRDSHDGTLIKALPVGEYGFVRATVRGLVRTRRALGENDKSLPFLIELRESGRLMLIDPLTDQEVDLWAFGSSNAQQFAQFLEEDESSMSSSREVSSLVVPGGTEADSDAKPELSN